MKIVTKGVDKREATRKKRTSSGLMKLQGAKVLGEWSTLQNDRTFVLLDVTDPHDLVRLVAPYYDLVDDEILPVMETEEMLKLLSTLK